MKLPAAWVSLDGAFAKGDYPSNWLDLAHKRLAAAVFAAYGWRSVLSDEEILEKLLSLNLERAKN